jgi:hypothetical protein
MERACGNGKAAKMGNSKVGVGHWNRRREKWATGDLMARHLQECSRKVVKNNHKTGENRVHSHNNSEHSHNRVHSHNNREHSHNTVHSHNNTEHSQNNRVHSHNNRVLTQQSSTYTTI